MTTWRKSSYSGEPNPDCVEVADLNGSVGIRDSKNTYSAYLAVPPSAFAALTGRIKSGDLDRTKQHDHLA